MKKIQASELIKRLINYCKKNDYSISTQDPTANGLDDISVDGPPGDTYLVTEHRNGLTIPITSGTLLEVAVVDFRLLELDEEMSLDDIELGYMQWKYRSDTVYGKHNRYRR